MYSRGALAHKVPEFATQRRERGHGHWKWQIAALRGAGFLPTGEHEDMKTCSVRLGLGLARPSWLCRLPFVLSQELVNVENNPMPLSEVRIWLSMRLCVTGLVHA